MEDREKAEIVMEGCVKMMIPRRYGRGGNGEAQGGFTRCRIVEDLIRGERRRWRVISSGIEFVRDPFLEMWFKGTTFENTTYVEGVNK
jgi:hypothetical protein